MSRYTGPRLRVMRALGVNLPGLSGKSIDTNPHPPGQHGPTARRKRSLYAGRLREKQKLRFHYGLTERQMRIVRCAANGDATFVWVSCSRNRPSRGWPRPSTLKATAARTRRPSSTASSRWCSSSPAAVICGRCSAFIPPVVSPGATVGLTAPWRRDVYGVQAWALDAEQGAPASLDEMAASYVERIRTVQPRGPYHLLGWSVGGIIAHAMAVQLQSVGELVGSLTLLDAYPSDRWRSQPNPRPARHCARCW